MDALAARLAGEPGPAAAYSAALERYLALGGGDLPARAGAVCAEVGLGRRLGQPLATLSGGQAARARLAALLLSRFEVLCLDEPTNDLDFEGLDRLERFVAGLRGSLVVVSHDRVFLDRTVTADRRDRPVDRRAGRVRRRMERLRGRPGTGATTPSTRAFEQTEERRRELEALVRELRARRRAARSRDAHRRRRPSRRPTRSRRKLRQARARARAARAGRQAVRAVAAAPSLAPARAGRSSSRGWRTLSASAATFRLGPVDLELHRATAWRSPGATAAASRRCSRRCSAAAARRRATGLGRASSSATRPARGRATTTTSRCSRPSPSAPAFAPSTRGRCLRSSVSARSTSSGPADALAGRAHPCRARLLMARGVNLLVLDEPTNHLDLEAIEELEAALEAYDGTLVVVSHDRRLLEAVQRHAPARPRRGGPAGRADHTRRGSTARRRRPASAPRRPGPTRVPHLGGIAPAARERHPGNVPRLRRDRAETAATKRRERPEDARDRLLYCAPGHGCPEEENLEVTPRQAPSNAQLEAPRVNECPTCHRPKRPHRVCLNCGTYSGREVEPLRHRRPVGPCRASRSTRWAGTAARRRSSPARSRLRTTASRRSSSAREASTHTASS